MFAQGTLEFLSALKVNNDRDWFNANKDTYKTEYEAPAKSFMSLMTDRLEELTGQKQKAKLFRIHRDVRFSKDKTPYNTHIHISWTPQDVGETPSWMFGLSPDYCTVGCGQFAFSKEKLDRFRRTIVEDGLTFSAMADDLVAQGYRFNEPELKRVPSGYPAESAYENWLKYKGIAIWHDFADAKDSLNPNLGDQTLVIFNNMISLNNFIQEV